MSTLNTIEGAVAVMDQALPPESEQPQSPSLEECALQSYTPLVFSIHTVTPNTVTADALAEQLRKDESLRNCLHFVDAGRFMKELGAKQPSGKTKNSSKADRAQPEVDVGRCTAEYVRREMVRIAVGLEEGRRAAVAARAQALEMLKLEYMDDGLSPEDARRAAEEDMAADEQDDGSDEGDNEDGGKAPVRHPTFLCIRGFPTKLEHLDELQTAGVPMSVLLDVYSRVSVPTCGGVTGDVDKISEKPRSSRSRSQAAATGQGKGKRVPEETFDVSLPALLAARHTTRKIGERTAADEVLVAKYEFPCTGGAESGSGGPARLAISEKAAVIAVRDLLLALEAQFHLFCEWRASRAVIDVPAYDPMLDPDAVQPVPGAEEAEERSAGGAKRRSVSPPKRGQSLLGDGTGGDGIAKAAPVTTPAAPIHMSQVAALQHVYEAYKRTRRAADDAPSRAFSVREFLHACGAQVQHSVSMAAAIATTAATVNAAMAQGEANDAILPQSKPAPMLKGAMLPNKEERARAEMVTEQDAVTEMVKGVFATVMSSTAPLGPFRTISKVDEVEGTEDVKTGPLGNGTAPASTFQQESESKEMTAEDDLYKVLLRTLQTLSPELPLEVAQKQVDAVLRLGLSADQKWDTDAWLKDKNGNGWRQALVKWGAALNACEVTVLSRGDGGSRTQHCGYVFEGATTFAEFVEWLRLCEDERTFFYPPPPDSDDEDAGTEEVVTEDDESDEEDEDGNIIPRRRREPEPLPLLDHVGIIQSRLRRRRAHDLLLRTVRGPCRQELLSKGTGARAALSEIEWMFPSDGCVIEVERTCANTRQLTCNVRALRGVEFGFMLTEVAHENPAPLSWAATSPSAMAGAKISPSGGGSAPHSGRFSVPMDETLLQQSFRQQPAKTVPTHIPSIVRTHVSLAGGLTVFAEVIADNTVVAEQASYANAVAAAREEAQALFEAQMAKTKGPKSRDKNAVPPPTCAELEEQLVAAIPVPLTRSKDPPLLQLVLSLGHRERVGVFDEEFARLRLVSPPLTPEFDLHVCVWRRGVVEKLSVRSYTHIDFYAGGTMEVFSRDTDGYRIVLDRSGGYATSRDGACLCVSAAGECTVRGAAGVSRLPPLLSAVSTGTTLERSDGERQTIVEGELARVRFGGSGVEVMHNHREGRCVWSIDGLPRVVMGTEGADTIDVEDEAGSVVFDLAQHTVRVKEPALLGGAPVAYFDLLEYHLHATPAFQCAGRGSTYSIDCAFGGLYGSVDCEGGASDVNKYTVYRVSPYGRCSEERNGVLVTPPIYTTPEAQPLMRYEEVLCPEFVEALQRTEFVLARDALHVKADYVATINNRVTRNNNSSTATHMTLRRFYDDEGGRKLLKAIGCEGSLYGPYRNLLGCIVATGLQDKGAREVRFVTPPVALGLAQQWISRIPHNRHPVIASCGEKTSDPKIYAIAFHPMPAASLVRELDYVLVLCPSTGVDGHVSVTPPQLDALLDESRATEMKTEGLSRMTAATPRVLTLVDSVTPVVLNTRVQLLASTQEQEQEQGQKPATSAAPIPVAATTNAVTRFNYWELGGASTLAALETPVESTSQREASRTLEVTVRKANVKQPQQLRDAADGAAAAAERTGYEHLASLRVNSRAASPLGTWSSANGTPPLMQSCRRTMGMLTGTTASTRGHCPALRATPTSVDLGNLIAGRRYATLLYLTNTSTVPCRYRLVVPPVHRSYLSVDFCKRFLAAGLTEAAEVHLSGTQPIGFMETQVWLRHEGSTIAINLQWNTVEGSAEDIMLAPETYCLGPTETPFQPGTIRRYKVRNSDDDEPNVFEQTGSDSDTSDTSNNDEHGETQTMRVS